MWSWIVSNFNKIKAVCSSWYYKIRSFCVYWYGKISIVCISWYSKIKEVCVSWYGKIKDICIDWYNYIKTICIDYKNKIIIFFRDWYSTIKTFLVDWKGKIIIFFRDWYGIIKTFLVDWKGKIIHFFRYDLPEWIDFLRNYKEQVKSIVKEIFPGLFHTQITGSSRTNALVFTYFDKIKTICVDWYEKLYDILVTHWDNFIDFLRHPFEYLRNIVFPLLGEMIGALADGLITYIKDKWGDEK